MSTQAIHQFLECGIELAALPLPNRSAVSAEIRVLVGCAHEPADKLGINHLLEQTITKGTSRRDGRALADALDALGIRWGSWAGREASGYQFTCLPEFVEQAIELHVEFLCMPTFPEQSVQVAIEHAMQELVNLEDDPDELSSKLFARQIYGPTLGRHILGESEKLQTIDRKDIETHWRNHYHAGRLQLAIAGPIDPVRIEEKLNQCFGRLGSRQKASREGFDIEFKPMSAHHHKELEQEHIGICYPGANLNDHRRYAQRAAIGVLSGGMSARLFTEVREKQGLVYWVSAWTEHPRGLGMVYLGASTTPERCEKTYQTLLREVDRLELDLEESELRRSITGLVARSETRGDITRARCAELADDMFHYGAVIPREEKIARIQAVTLADVKEYLQSFPRDKLSVLSLGSKKLELISK